MSISTKTGKTLRPPDFFSKRPTSKIQTWRKNSLNHYGKWPMKVRWMSLSSIPIFRILINLSKFGTIPKNVFSSLPSLWSAWPWFSYPIGWPFWPYLVALGALCWWWWDLWYNGVFILMSFRWLPWSCALDFQSVRVLKDDDYVQVEDFLGRNRKLRWIVWTKLW